MVKREFKIGSKRGSFIVHELTQIKEEPNPLQCKTEKALKEFKNVPSLDLGVTISKSDLNFLKSHSYKVLQGSKLKSTQKPPIQRSKFSLDCCKKKQTQLNKNLKIFRQHTLLPKCKSPKQSKNKPLKQEIKQTQITEESNSLIFNSTERKQHRNNPLNCMSTYGSDT